MWHVLVPVKGGDHAKSRLALGRDARRALAAAMASDTVEAAHACPVVSRVTVLASSSGAADLTAPVQVLLEPLHPPRGFNALLDWATAQLPAGPVAVVMGDLPALTPHALAEVLEGAGAVSRALVVDRHGTGTTLLASRSARDLRPAFGPGSAAAHEAGGARSVDAPARVRCDVDDVEDLRHASALGVGPRTAAVLADRSVALAVAGSAAD
jgi:2-phospho-L-lactate/phosphoenolpyruvate guanylyltransferase